MFHEILSFLQSGWFIVLEQDGESGRMVMRNLALTFSWTLESIMIQYFYSCMWCSTLTGCHLLNWPINPRCDNMRWFFTHLSEALCEMYIRDEVVFALYLQKKTSKCYTATAKRCVNWGNPPVSPLESLDDPQGPGLLMLIDILFYGRPLENWPLLQQWPKWEWQILLLIKAKQLVYLFTSEWFLLTYEKECDKFCIQTTSLAPKRLEDQDCLLSTLSLTFMMREMIADLIKPVTYSWEMG